MYLARFVLVIISCFGLVVLPSPASALAAQSACEFTLGFKALREQIGERVGECIEDERFNLENGNAEQRTTGGLLVWRKADNWTAFTDGTTSGSMVRGAW